MNVIIATSRHSSSSFYADWLAIVTAIPTLACFMAFLRRVQSAVLVTEAGMFVFKDGREFGFPIGEGAYPNAGDFPATY